MRVSRRRGAPSPTAWLRVTSAPSGSRRRAGSPRRSALHCGRSPPPATRIPRAGRAAAGTGPCVARDAHHGFPHRSRDRARDPCPSRRTDLGRRVPQLAKRAIPARGTLAKHPHPVPPRPRRDLRSPRLPSPGSVKTSSPARVDASSRWISCPSRTVGRVCRVTSTSRRTRGSGRGSTTDLPR